MARPTLAPSERLVGDLADECLNEGVLTALWTARVVRLAEQLTSNERAQAWL
jgi:hypothetical protein